MLMHQDMSQPPPGYHPPAMPFVSQPPPTVRPAQPPVQQTIVIDEKYAKNYSSTKYVMNKF